MSVVTKSQRALNARRFDPHTCVGCGSPTKFKRCRDGVHRWVCTFAARCC